MLKDARSRVDLRAHNRTAHSISRHALLTLGVIAAALGWTDAAYAQNISSSLGTPTPNYNVDTSTLGANVDQTALNTQLSNITNDITLSQDQKVAAIKAAVNSATNLPGAACAQQLDPIANAFGLTSDALGIAGDIGEAIGAAGAISDFEIPGIVVQTVGDGFGLASDIVGSVQLAMPDCSTEFTGTILVDANIAANQGISAFNGHINLGNADGVSYQAGIAVGGGSISGVGTLGHQATTGAASAIAIGNDAVATSANSTVLGDSAHGSATGATALGANSNASAASSTAVGQSAAAKGAASIALGSQATANNDRSVAVGAQTQADGDGATVVGTNAVVFADGGTAIGDSAQVGGSNAIAMGSHSVATGQDSVAIGSNAQSTAANSVAIGTGSIADEQDTVSVGSSTLQRRITNVAAGTNTTDAVNLGQLEAVKAAGDFQISIINQNLAITNQTLNTTIQNLAITNQNLNITNIHLDQVDARVVTNTTNISQIVNGTSGQIHVNNTSNAGPPQATGGDTIAAGPGAKATGTSSTAIGINSTATATESIAIGNNASATGDQSTTLGDGASASGTNSVVLGANSSDGGQNNVVSVGSADSTRRIINVSNGVGPHDAVNVSQLVGASATTLGLANAYTDVRFGQVVTELNDVRRDANAATASALAVSAIPQTFESGKSIVGVGTGTWDGQSAIAIGASTATANGRFIFKLGATLNSRGDAGGAAGAGISF